VTRAAQEGIMRLIPVIIAALLTLCGTASAQEWTEYLDRQARFSINFPGRPAVREITYTSATGAAVPARVFTASYGSARYSLTAVDFNTRLAAAGDALTHAANVLRRRGTVLVQASEDLDDGIPGRQLSIREPDGRLLLASIYMYDHRLYIAEGNVAAGEAPALQFSQSIEVLDAEGKQVNPNPGGRGAGAAAPAPARGY
jgi:hypothetical protein